MCPQSVTDRGYKKSVTNSLYEKCAETAFDCMESILPSNKVDNEFATQLMAVKLIHFLHLVLLSYPDNSLIPCRQVQTCCLVSYPDDIISWHLYILASSYPYDIISWQFHILMTSYHDDNWNKDGTKLFGLLWLRPKRRISKQQYSTI